jgi:hypothetical protein
VEVTVWELWLPILVSGVVLFFLSAAAWMLLPHHKPEWKGLPNEDALTKTLRETDIPAGQYMFPYCERHADSKSEEMKRRMQTGPHGTLYVWPGAPNMGINMACTVAFFIIANFVIAYLATMALDRGDSFMEVLRFVGTAAILTYASAPILNGIWFRRKMLADIIDGIVFGLVTGLLFAAMWPGATG